MSRNVSRICKYLRICASLRIQYAIKNTATAVTFGGLYYIPLEIPRNAYKWETVPARRMKIFSRCPIHDAGDLNGRIVRLATGEGR